MQLCCKAIQGEEESMQELNLESVQVKLPRTVHLDKNTLQIELAKTLTMATAAKKLKRPFI